MKVAYLINTTPKYFFLLPLHLELIKRYCAVIPFDIWLATEEPQHPIVQSLTDIKVIELTQDEKGFLASRAAALKKLPARYEMVLPMQEDFLLERTPNFEFVLESFEIMRDDIKVDSIRWMPCPGPAEKDPLWSPKIPQWKVLQPDNNEYMFCFQATLWRRSALQTWFTRLVAQFDIDYPAMISEEERRMLEIRANYAENRKGQAYFREWMTGTHLAWVRSHKAPNAVYMSPWPYRPTAVVGGKLEIWAIEMAKREGFTISQ
jgi:hypothetical protein